MATRKEPRRSTDLTPSEFSKASKSSHSLPSQVPKVYNPFSPNQEPHYDSPSVAETSKTIPIPDRGHGKQLTKGAMDPFEVRIRFTQHLQHLNASVTSANKAAQYAIKYRDMDEDLHSCILEQLERVGFIPLYFPFIFSQSCFKELQTLQVKKC